MNRLLNCILLIYFLVSLMLVAGAFTASNLNEFWICFLCAVLVALAGLRRYMDWMIEHD